MSGALIGIRLEGVLAGVSLDMPSAWIELVILGPIDGGLKNYTLCEYYGEYGDESKDKEDVLTTRDVFIDIDAYLAKQFGEDVLGKHISKKNSGIDYQLKIVDVWGTKVDAFVNTIKLLKSMQEEGYWIEVDL